MPDQSDNAISPDQFRQALLARFFGTAPQQPALSSFFARVAGGTTPPGPAGGGRALPTNLGTQSDPSGDARPAPPTLSGKWNAKPIPPAGILSRSGGPTAGDRALPSFASSNQSTAETGTDPGNQPPAATYYPQNITEPPRSAKDKILHALYTGGIALAAGVPEAQQYWHNFMNPTEASIAKRQAQDAANFIVFKNHAAEQKLPLDIADTQSQINERNAQADQDRAKAAADANPQPKYARAVIQDPADPTQPLAVDFDQKSGAYINPDNGEAIPDAKPWEKPVRYASPFEAYAYGSPDEKKAASDFLTLEKQLGDKNEKPGEIEQRYQLYKKDPAAYRAMFGDRGSAQDDTQAAREQAQATRMLNYFDRQRKGIEGDFTLDDQTKQQRLAEIDELEKPYRDLAKPNASPAGNGRGNGRTAAAGQGGDVVTVINPQGVTGTIPRANLQKALAKGYKLAGNQ